MCCGGGALVGGHPLFWCRAIGGKCRHPLFSGSVVFAKVARSAAREVRAALLSGVLGKVLRRVVTAVSLS